MSCLGTPSSALGSQPLQTSAAGRHLDLLGGCSRQEGSSKNWAGAPETEGRHWRVRPESCYKKEQFQQASWIFPKCFIKHLD